MLGSPADIAAELKHTAFAAGWPERVTAQIADLAANVACRSGAVIFREGEENDNIYVVVSGRVALEMSVLARGPIRLLTLSRGELLGWSPLIGNREMTATGVALEESRLLRISGRELLALCRQDHEIGFAVMHRVACALSQRLTATRLQLLDLFSHSAPDVVPVAAGGEPP